jgi:membrane dipeptidase
VRDTARFWGWVRDNAHMWPPGPNSRTGSAFAQPEQIEELTGMMLQAGYGDAAVRGILGGNWLRVARQVWR